MKQDRSQVWPGGDRLRWLRSPTLADPEEQVRARVLHRLSLTVLVTMTPLAALVPVIEETWRSILPIYAVAIAGAALMLVLVAQRRVKLAGMAFAVVGWTVTLWASFAVGGIQSPQLAMAVLVIMLAGFVWGGGAAIGMAVLTSVSLAALEVLRDQGIAPEPFITATRLTTWAALSSVVALSAVLLQMFIRVMREARDDAAEKSLRLEEEMERRIETEASLHRAQKLEALGRLTGGIAHDFNNILTVLLGEAELLEEAAREGRPLGEEELEQLAAIRIGAERAAALTSQLLAFSRHPVGVPEVVRPDASIERLRPMLERLIREDVSLEVAPGAGDRGVRIDPAQLDQIVMNLVLNASDAMPQGGRLQVETEHVDVARDAAWRDPNAATGDHVMIAVHDTGAGIEAGDLDRIFDPFFTTKQMGRGTGLGLASTHGIVTGAGGHISVESTPGAGTTFRVFLPEAGVVPAPVETRTGRGPVLDGARVLLCEDDDAVRRITQRTLAGAGYETVETSTAEAALEWLRASPKPIDLLVTDVILPGQSGAWLAQRVTESFPEIRILLLSGYTANVLDETGLPSEAELLEKPFKPEVLLERVAGILAEDAPA